MKIRSFNKKTIAGAVSLTVLGGSGAIFAEPKALEEVFVTANKRTESLMDVSQSIQFVSGMALEEKGIGDMIESSQLIPSVSMAPGSGNGAPVYNMRGTGAQGMTGDASVGFYIDDVPFYSPGIGFFPELDLYDIDSVQVLRGPQGTLYGQGAMGGTMVVTSNKPDLESMRLHGQITYFDMNEGEAGKGADIAGSIPLIQDTLAIGGTVGYKYNPGLAESIAFPGEENLDSEERDTTRLKLRWEATDSLSVNATYWNYEMEADHSHGVYTQNDPPRLDGASGGPGDGHMMDVDLIGLTVSWDTPIGTLTSITSRTDLLWYVALSFNYDLGPGIGVQRIAQSALFESVADSQELRLVSNGDGPWEWVVGANFVDADRTTPVHTEVGASPVLFAATAATAGGLSIYAQNVMNNPGSATAPLAGLEQDSFAATKTKQFAVFGELSRAFFDDKLTALIGVRSFEDEREEYQQSSGGITNEPYEDTISDTFKSVSPRFNLNFTPTDTTTVFFNAAKGFRSGLFNSPNAVSVNATLGIDIPRVVDESSLWSYEIGARLSMFNGSLFLEPSIYLSKFDPYQFEAQTAGGKAAIPVDDVESKGVEALLTWQTPIDGLIIDVMGAKNETQPKKLTDGRLPDSSIKEGEQLPNVPEWQYRFGASYSHQLFSSDYDGFANLGYYRRGAQKDVQKTPNGEVLYSEIVTDLTLRLGVRSDRWGVTLWGKNLTDSTGPANTTNGGWLASRTDRRSIGITLEASLGR